MSLTEIVKINGVQYKIPALLAVGDSIFLPCLDRHVTMQKLRNYYGFYGLGYKLTFEERVERGLLGIRVWRVL